MLHLQYVPLSKNQQLKMSCKDYEDCMHAIYIVTACDRLHFAFLTNKHSASLSTMHSTVAEMARSLVVVTIKVPL